MLIIPHVNNSVKKMFDYKKNIRQKNIFMKKNRFFIYLAL